MIDPSRLSGQDIVSEEGDLHCGQLTLPSRLCAAVRSIGFQQADALLDRFEFSAQRIRFPA